MLYESNYDGTSYLAHHGVKGMKWGVRRVRGHAGTGRYLTRKRQLAGDKRDLAYMNKGGHLSKGITKKRQQQYDARDRRIIEDRIKKNEGEISAKKNKQISRNKKRDARHYKEYSRNKAQAELYQAHVRAGDKSFRRAKYMSEAAKYSRRADKALSKVSKEYIRDLKTSKSKEINKGKDSWDTFSNRLNKLDSLGIPPEEQTIDMVHDDRAVNAWLKKHK